MTYENIKIPLPSFTIRNNTFFFFKHTNNLLYEKNSNGDVIFTYPLNSTLGSEVLSTYYDGTNFWTLQEGTSAFDRVIKRWRIEDYFCELKELIYLDSATTDYNYQINSFVVENFQTKLANDLTIGASSLEVVDYNSQIDAGSILTIGPNLDGFYEEVTVTGTLPDGSVGLDFFTSFEHTKDESVVFVNNLWFFNDYDHKVLQGTLNRYSIKDATMTYTYLDDAFSGVDASSFHRGAHENYVIFVLETTLRFFDIEVLDVTKALLMDNMKVDGVTVIPVKEIEIVDDTVYRLQNYMTYYGTNYSQTTYNYQCSTIRSFIDSVTMDVSPKILPSDGVSIAEASAVVQDQYGQPAQYKVVRFFDDDTELGYMTIPEPLTDLSGLAYSYYRAGVSPKSIIITALITQYD